MYQIIRDYGTAGWSLDNDKKFETIDEAVRYGIAGAFGNPFLVITVHNWLAKEVE